jgi:hypothetical protein
MNILTETFFIGIIATLFMDIWALFIKRVFKIRGLDYALLGRWGGHMIKGQFYHKNIMNADYVKGEKTIGYFLHYSIGVLFAALLTIGPFQSWRTNYSMVIPIIIGISTSAAPFFIMQPMFGFGIAGAKLTSPNLARAKSLMAHTSYGIGLYLGILCLRLNTSLLN